ncbi:MAG: NAD(+)/NADH kinase [Eubacterium sp.]|nr:NAD(+)/NADH kinase [Eubacterium sp.]
MKQFFLITNHCKDPELSVSNAVITYLHEHGGKAQLRLVEADGPEKHMIPEEVPPETECILVLGGDGTLVRAAVDLVSLQIPLLGINLGTLGFLAEIDRDSIYSALDAVLDDRFNIQNRMMLRGDVWHEGEKIYSGRSLNEIVVCRDGLPHIIPLKNYVNGKYLNSYQAEGLIVSTATGSTGYSLSVGGPIIAPQAELFLMTPLAPHTLNTRSVILREESRIRIEVDVGHTGAVRDAAAMFDGGKACSLVTGDYVEIRKAGNSAKFIRISDDSFLETLQRKMKQ